MCALFAATYPERCDRLALFLPHARAVRSDSYPYGMTKDQALEWLRERRSSWGDRDHLESFARALRSGIATYGWSQVTEYLRARSA